MRAAPHYIPRQHIAHKITGISQNTQTNSPIPNANIARPRFTLPLNLLVDLATRFLELRRLLLHPLLDGFIYRNPLGLGEFPNILGNAHAAKLGSTHRTKMRGFSRLGGQRLIMIGSCARRVEGQIELILPAKFEAGFGDRIVADIGPGMTLG